MRNYKIQRKLKSDFERRQKMSFLKSLVIKGERETGKTSFQRIEMRRLIAGFEGEGERSKISEILKS